MHRNICSSAGVSSLRMPLATTIAIAMAILASLGQASAMDGAIYSEKTPDRIMPDQEIPLDALGYLGGLFEARFYQPHFTTDDPRDEIREAVALYGVDLAMMMSIAKVESDFNPRARTGSYKGLFQLSDYEFKKYGDGSIWDARDNARAAAHMFLVQAEKFRWAPGHYPDRGSPCVRPRPRTQPYSKAPELPRVVERDQESARASASGTSGASMAAWVRFTKASSQK